MIELGTKLACQLGAGNENTANAPPIALVGGAADFLLEAADSQVDPLRNLVVFAGQKRNIIFANPAIVALKRAENSISIKLVDHAGFIGIFIKRELQHATQAGGGGF